MGGVRAAHGSFAAAAAAALASAAATVDIPEKLHLKATPILFHAVPISLPLPPLSSLQDSSLCLPPRLSTKDSATPPLTTSSPSLASPCARETYASSDFSLAQGAAPVVISSRLMASLAQCPGLKAPALAPFCFATSGLYSAPVTAKLGFQPARIDASLHSSSGFRGVSSFAVAAHPSAYLESLLSSFRSSSVPDLATDSESLHAWHVRKGRGEDEGALGDEKRPVLTVVLLGWLGAQQKHLRKYAEWYNARGIHAVTFVIPMTDLLSFKGQGNAEEHVDSLARHLVQWLNEQVEHADLEGEKQLIFHTFSNTGWLTYGAILEKMQKEGGNLVERIKGCVVDSAPVPDPDPQVWASGFSAALLKKRSSATKPASLNGEVEEGVTVEASSLGSVANLEVGGAKGLEAAVLSVLEGFFSLFLKLPAINQRLSEVVTVLQKKQPPCPQLYIYSTADKVIPVKAVEAFIEEQRKAGRVVRACNLQSSPHVDHFRSHPQLYSEQLVNFLKEVLPSTVNTL